MAKRKVVEQDFEPEVTEVVPEELVAPVERIEGKPEAQFVLDLFTAHSWAKNFWERRQNSFSSIRVEPEILASGLDVSLLLRLMWMALVPGGLLFLPEGIPQDWFSTRESEFAGWCVVEKPA